MPVDSSRKLIQAQDQDMSNESMCSTCQSLLVRPDEKIGEHNPALYDFGTISQSALGGCPICKIFYAELHLDESPCIIGLSAHVIFYIHEHILEKDRKLAGLIELDVVKSDGKTTLSIVLLPSLNLGNRDCLKQAAVWMQNCVANHRDCNTNLRTTHSTIRPARVLDISGSAARLVTIADMEDTALLAPYITVSHRWMAHGMPKLLGYNFQAMQQGVAPHTLPAVFQDSIVLVRALGIRHVWIDSLCIIQDDPSDMQTEISNMGQIYRNAILNVGALKTSNAEQAKNNESPGLFVDCRSRGTSPFPLTVQRANSKETYFAHREERADSLNRSCLTERGWVLQERLLSRRSIYFGTHVWWECGEQLATDRFPDGFAWSKNYGGYYGEEAPYRITTILNPPKHDRPSDTEASHTRHIYKSWEHIITTFNTCKLTFEQDYLSALSGIAQDFQAALNENYYAGLWEGNMMRGLLWRRHTFGFGDHGVRTREYRAPSWSWASVNTEIFFILDHRKHQNIIAEVHEVNTVPVGSDTTGRLSGGHLSISGHLQRSYRTVSKRYTRHTKMGSMNRLPIQYEWFEDGYTDDGDRPMINYSFFLMAYQKDRYTSKVHFKTLTTEEAKGNQEINGDKFSVDIGHVYGLILETVNLENSVYRRIGSFGHLWGDGRTFEDNPKSEDYPEFLNFDPNSFERHTITII